VISTDIVKSIEGANLHGQHVEIVHFFDGKALVLGYNAIALYKNAATITDQLGNGLIAMAELAPQDYFDTDNAPWVVEHAAGFVGFSCGRALLILPKAIKLYATKQDALNNAPAIAELPLTHS